LLYKTNSTSSDHGIKSSARDWRRTLAWYPFQLFLLSFSQYTCAEIRSGLVARRDFRRTECQATQIVSHLSSFSHHYSSDHFSLQTNSTQLILDISLLVSFVPRDDFVTTPRKCEEAEPSSSLPRRGLETSPKHDMIVVAIRSWKAVCILGFTWSNEGQTKEAISSYLMSYKFKGLCVDRQVWHRGQSAQISIPRSFLQQRRSIPGNTASRFLQEFRDGRRKCREDPFHLRSWQWACLKSSLMFARDK